VAFGMAVAVSLVVLFMPESGVPPAIPGTDKLVHLSLFAALAGTGVLGGSRRRWLVPALLAYAVSSEFIQSIDLLGRSASVTDVIADTLGVGFGLLLALRWARRRAAA
jgi:VanZ family protein